MDVNPSPLSRRPPSPRPRSAGLVTAVVITVALLLTILVASPASAGGWAVTELDEIPEPAAGETIEVAFTIRQHGVTPVDLESDVGIDVTTPDGTTTSFDAVQSGPTGHYVADVTFGDAGRHTWTVRQGWFAPQELGPVTVVPATGSPSGAALTAGAGPVTDQHRFPALVRFGLPALAALLALVAAADGFVSRRRHHPSLSPQSTTA